MGGVAANFRFVNDLRHWVFDAHSILANMCVQFSYFNRVPHSKSNMDAPCKSARSHRGPLSHVCPVKHTQLHRKRPTKRDSCTSLYNVQPFSFKICIHHNVFHAVCLVWDNLGHVVLVYPVFSECQSVCTGWDEI